MKLLTLVALSLVVACAQAANYAVLVAGSNGYYNYRHQSDICHAFHVLTNSTEGAFPKENVIVFMYDDIANDPENPVQGNLINHPDGPNVYPGVNKDYTGELVTPENYLAVITGNKSAPGRVLESGPDDNVFLYFSDHGAPGLIAFPSEYLYANQLIAALQTMQQKKMYKNLVFYIEACEAGSMFDGLLPANMSIYATTAANPDQSSYACYYDATRQTYLGDEYSVRWMEDADANDHTGSKETLEKQFDTVVNETLQSNPQQYGDQRMSSDLIRAFEAFNAGGEVSPSGGAVLAPQYTPCGDSADSRDVKIKTLQHRRDAAKTTEDVMKYNGMIQAELVHRATADLQIDSVIEQLAVSRKSHMKTVHHQPRNFECLQSSIEQYEKACGKFSDYSLKWIYVLVNLCEEGFDANKIGAAARNVCA